MNSIYRRVYKFNEDAGTPMSQPTLTTKQYVNEIDMLNEEVDELLTAFRQNDRVEMADALGDIIYVALGTMGKLGMNAESILNEICRSNESKYTNGVLVKNENGKIQKGPTFRHPDLSFSSSPLTSSDLFKTDLATVDESQVKTTKRTNRRGS